MGDEVVEQKVLIQNERGLHARAATQLVQLAAKFPCEITVSKDGHEVNGKSIMGVLMLVAPKGTTVTVRAKGERAAEAVAAIAKLIDDKFGEDASGGAGSGGEREHARCFGVGVGRPRPDQRTTFPRSGLPGAGDRAAGHGSAR